MASLQSIRFVDRRAHNSKKHLSRHTSNNYTHNYTYMGRPSYLRRRDAITNDRSYQRSYPTKPFPRSFAKYQTKSYPLPERRVYTPDLPQRIISRQASPKPSEPATIPTPIPAIEIPAPVATTTATEVGPPPRHRHYRVHYDYLPELTPRRESELMQEFGLSSIGFIRTSEDFNSDVFDEEEEEEDVGMYDNAPFVAEEEDPELDAMLDDIFEELGLNEEEWDQFSEDGGSDDGYASDGAVPKAIKPHLGLTFPC